MLEEDRGLRPAGPLARLVAAIDRAASAGWADTARLVVLMAAAAGALVLVIRAGR